MTRKIFVNLPVKRLDRAQAFFGGLGFTFEPRFTNDEAACMVVSDAIYVMLLTEAKFAGFAPRPVCDAHQCTETLVCLTCASREEVDELVRRAVAGGGTVYRAAQDYGFMYGHGFLDLDGHCWELVYMVPDETAPA